jgi:biotin transport system substrate-specific component
MPLAPITLQLQIALLAGILLGGKWGGLSVLIYLALGVMGLPVFASGGGIAYVLQPTFGYLLGFALSAFVSGKIARSGVITYRRISVALAVGLAIAYGVGLIYAACILTLYLNQSLLLWEFLLGYLLLTLPKDVILTALTVPLAKRLLPHVL